LEDLLTPAEWWQQLELEWKETFRHSVLLHSNEPDANELNGLFNMQTLRLAGPKAPFPNSQVELTNLSGVENLVKLSLLIVTHHKIVTLVPLSGLHRLKSLFLFNNSINSLNGVEALFNLEQLYVQHNQITSIKPVEQLVNLKEFYIHDNCISSLEGLTENHADKLTRLVCRPNEQLKQKEIIWAERELGIICR
jgi:Leucine-rich repeat (LRR) protein